MTYGSELEAFGAAETAAATHRKRRHIRQKIQSLAYVNLDQANGGIIRDLSEGGIALQAVAPLRPNQQIFLRFELLNPRIRMEAAGRVAWADAMGQAGVEFLSISQRSRPQLKDWLLTQLLGTAHEAVQHSVFAHGDRFGEAAELIFSSVPRSSIPLEPQAATRRELRLRPGKADQPPAAEGRGRPVQVHDFPFSISSRAVPRLVDGLALLSAILLFSAVSLATTHVSLAWHVALGLACGVLCLFALVYWFLFAICLGVTPGDRLAQLAAESDGIHTREDERPRFR
jgi:Tfp pilus assembly protein PilZ